MPLLSLSVTQLLLAFVSASILHKLILSKFFLRWLASHKFIYFLPPIDSTLRQLKKSQANSRAKDLSRNNPTKFRSKQRRYHAEARQTDRADSNFKIQASDLEHLQLEEARMSSLDLDSINYAIDLEWLVDLSLLSAFCFVITETQFYFYPDSNETNFSVIWALLVVGYSLKILWSLTAIYFKNEQSIGERSVCIVSGCFFMLIAMVVLLTKETYLEFGLDDAYRSLNRSVIALMDNHIPTQDSSKVQSKPISYILVKLMIAALCALTGVLFTFPGFRYGQLYHSIMDSNETSALRQTFLRLNYLCPLFIALLWVKPIARDQFLGQNILQVDDDSFNSIRIYIVLIANIFRFHLLPDFVCTFLQSSKNKLARIRFRGGTTTNKEVQVTIASIYNYTNVVVIQYILPILISLFTGLVLKFLGGISWIPYKTNSELSHTLSSQNTSAIHGEMNDNSTQTQGLNNPYMSSMQKLLGMVVSVKLDEFKCVLSTEVFKGMFGFATWWLHFTWFCTTTMGLIYHTYFSQ